MLFIKPLNKSRSQLDDGHSACRGLTDRAASTGIPETSLRILTTFVTAYGNILTQPSARLII